MRLLLSGGSHRAALGATGAIGYFLWSESTEDDPARPTDRWSDVTEVVSVSGGSIVNAALATRAPVTNDDTLELLAEIRRRHTEDGLLPHRSPRRLMITFAALAALAVAGWLLLAGFGVVGPSALSTSPWSILIGLATFPSLIGVERRLATRYQRDFIDKITLGTAQRIEDVASDRRHIICASGLASGLPYYFVAGGIDVFEPVYGAALTSGFTTADAAAASTALPAFGRVRAPAAFRRELLVDGGVSGGFGEQVTTTTIRRRPEDTWRSDDEWFAVDAVRHLMSNSRVGQILQSMSMIALLGRWLKVSLEATYVNDLIDLGPGHYARVWSPNELPVRRSPASATVFRDGSAAEKSTTHDDDDAQRVRLGELQTAVDKMGLAGLNRTSVDLGIVVGFVSTLEVRHGFSDPTIVEQALCWLDDQLEADGGLLRTWRGADGAEQR